MSLQREAMYFSGFMKAALTPDFSVRDAKKQQPAKFMVSTLLPFTARKVLMDAAKSKGERKSFKIDDAVEVVKMNYPQFFK
jgi:hypothetical protein